MVNTKFEAYKIKRELKRSGVTYTFERAKKNDFNESLSTTFPIGSIKGMYHEQGSGIQLATNEATQTRTKKVPMILCLYEDVTPLSLQIGDIVRINSKIFKVTGVANIQEWNIISDISLEVVDSGIPA